MHYVRMAFEVLLPAMFSLLCSLHKSHILSRQQVFFCQDKSFLLSRLQVFFCQGHIMTIKLWLTCLRLLHLFHLLPITFHIYQTILKKRISCLFHWPRCFSELGSFSNNSSMLPQNLSRFA